MISYEYVQTYDIECVKNSEPILVPHEKPKCYKCRLYSLYICIVILITCLVLMIVNLNFKDDDYINIAARAWPHSRVSCHKKLLCSDFKYGCCNISNFGTFKNNKTNFNEYHLDYNIIYKNDKNGFDCPTYRDLIKRYDDYNLKYRNYDYHKMKYCNSTIEKCCKIDTIYDNLFRLKKLNKSYTELKNYYNSNNFHQYIELNIKGRCPNYVNIINRYNKGYTDPNKLILLFLYLLSFILCLFGWISICSNNKRSR